MKKKCSKREPDYFGYYRIVGFIILYVYRGRKANIAIERMFVRASQSL